MALDKILKQILHKFATSNEKDDDKKEKDGSKSSNNRSSNRPADAAAEAAGRELAAAFLQGERGDDNSTEAPAVLDFILRGVNVSVHPSVAVAFLDALTEVWRHQSSTSSSSLSRQQSPPFEFIAQWVLSIEELQTTIRETWACSLILNACLFS